MNTESNRANQNDFMTIEKAPILEPFHITIEEFKDAWNTLKPNHIDYDPDIFPKRFEHDVKMVKYLWCMQKNKNE